MILRNKWSIIENTNGIVNYSKTEREDAKVPSVIPQACSDSDSL